jgi:hypothetical protein
VAARQAGELSRMVLAFSTPAHLLRLRAPTPPLQLCSAATHAAAAAAARPKLLSPSGDPAAAHETDRKILKSAQGTVSKSPTSVKSNQQQQKSSASEIGLYSPAALMTAAGSLLGSCSGSIAARRLEHWPGALSGDRLVRRIKAP